MNSHLQQSANTRVVWDSRTHEICPLQQLPSPESVESPTQRRTVLENTMLSSQEWCQGLHLLRHSHSMQMNTVGGSATCNDDNMHQHHHGFYQWEVVNVVSEGIHARYQGRGAHAPFDTQIPLGELTPEALNPIEMQNVLNNYYNHPTNTSFPSSSSEVVQNTTCHMLQASTSPCAWLQHASLLELIRKDPSQHVKDLEHTHLSRLLTYIHNMGETFSSMKFDIFSAPNAQHKERIDKAQSAVYVMSGKLYFPKKEFIRLSLKAMMDALSQHIKDLSRRNSIWILVNHQFYYTTCDAKRVNFPNCDNILQLNTDQTVSLRREDTLNGFSNKAVSPTSAVFRFKRSLFEKYHPNTDLPTHTLEKTTLICKRIAKPTSNPNKKGKEHDIWLRVDKE
ncbi:hypothetical protein C9374_006730 [Naegleria lovaniensis]|uniref:Uncharacterized protein n=1 Tax=Naegleria lovaniensis TaxID=51637 RepID=A0AA88GNJ9_NAELO|nr:uncharacterized protein C9374_006730 [Naegleria lovaniensis]KAG2379613.1 hypothetical protein C9374_006730 [Naegleria lovaniensis]